MEVVANEYQIKYESRRKLFKEMLRRSLYFNSDMYTIVGFLTVKRIVYELDGRYIDYEIPKEFRPETVSYTTITKMIKECMAELYTSVRYTCEPLKDGKYTLMKIVIVQST